MQPATVALDASAGSHFVSSDGVLEVTAPTGAVTSSDIAGAGGKVSLLVRQILPASGSNAGGSGHYSFGTYLVQVVDSSGHVARQGLRKPLQVGLHYDKRAAALDLRHAVAVVNTTLPPWVNPDPHSVKVGAAPSAPSTPAPTPRAGQQTPTPAPSQTPSPAAQPSLGSPSRQATTLNAASATLSAAVPMTTSTSSVSFDTNSAVATFGKPDPFTTDLSGGSLTASYPIDVPAGPGGLKPPLALAYNSGGVNGQHNVQGPGGFAGEGWNLSLGSISWAEHDANSLCLNWANPTGCTSNWEDSWELDDPNGTSAQLIPPNINVATYNDDSGNPVTPSPVTWHTAPDSHAKVISFTSPNAPAGMSPAPPCFRVFEPNGTVEEFGCTADSLQWYPDPSGANKGKSYIANWLLDLITDPNGNQIHVTYQQDVPRSIGTNVLYPRDVEMATVEWDSPNCHDAQNACTGSNWAPLMRVSFSAAPSVAHPGGNTCSGTTGLRCDDPADFENTGGLGVPLVENTFILNDVLVQVRGNSSAGWNTLRDYQLSYDQSGPTTITDPVSGLSESTAGKLLLTQMKVVGDDGSTSLPVTSFHYTKQTQYYEDSLAAPTPSTNCGPSWNNGVTPNGHTGCIMWSQSYEGNSYYLDTVSNGLGMQQSFSWLNARNNFHGANGGGDANIRNPDFCNSSSVQSTFPCNMPDDGTWSRIVLTQKKDQVTQISQAGQGGTQTSTPVAGTTSYSYQVPYPLKAWECSTCMASFYWGNQNDFDMLDYYNSQFMGFAQAAVSNPDGSVDVHMFHSTEGFGLYDTNQIACQAPGNNPCHNAPYWDLDNAAHGHEYELDSYDTTGTNLLRQVLTQWQATCPPSGVSGTPSSSSYGNWDGQLVAELDHSNPVAACDVQKAREDTYTPEGSWGGAHHATIYTYDSYGRQTTQTVMLGAGAADSALWYNGALIGGATQGATGLVSGDSDTAVTLDGSSGYLAAPSLYAMAAQTPTVELWFKTTSTGQQQILDAGAPYDNGKAFQVGLTQNGGVGRSPSVNTPGLYIAFWANDVYLPGLNLADGQAHYLAVGLSGSSLSVYVDGKTPSGLIWNGSTWSGMTAQPFTLPSAPSTPPEPLWVGHARSAVWSTGSTYFNGTIGEVAVYYSPLSSAQVQAHYTAGANYFNAVTGDIPAAYYRLNDGGGTTATPSTIVDQKSYVWNDAVTATATSATGTYLIDFLAYQGIRDAANTTGYTCTYNRYDGQSWLTGPTSSLTLGEETTSSKWAGCGSSSNSFTPSGQESRTSYTYDAFGNQLTSTDPNANAGIGGHVGCTLGSTQYSSCTTYDGVFNSLATTHANALNQATSSGYQTPASATAAGGFGLWPMSTTDANGQTTSLAYDALAREVGQTLPGEAAGLTTLATSYAVWCSGTNAQAPCVEVDKIRRLNSGQTVTYRGFYDGLGHLVETRSPGSGGQDVIKYNFYDSSGRLAFESVPYLVAAYSGGPGQSAYSIPDSTQAGTTYSYDGLDRVTSIIDALSNKTTSSYSFACAAAATNDPGCYEQKLTVDALGHQSGTLSDGMGRLQYAQRYSGNSTSTYSVYATTAYTFDYAGNLTQILQPDGTTKTTFQYDAMGRKTAMSDPDRGNETYSYDPDGNLLQQTDARGVAGTIYTGYDGIDRPLWRNTTNSSTGATVTFTYDSTANSNQGIGRLTGETFSGGSGGSLSGSYSYVYDARGQQTSQTVAVNGAAYQLQTAYDDAGNVLSLRYPDGETVTNSYTSTGFLSGVSTQQGSTTTQLLGGAGYNAFSDLTAGTLNGSTYQYSASDDLNGRQTDVAVKRTSDSATMFEQARTLDPAGNISTATTTVPAGTDSQVFCYDTQNRLTWAGSSGTPPCTGTAISGSTLSGAQYSQSFGYDGMGRLTSGPQGTYTYGDPAHVHGATAIGSGYTASYDAAGNMTCRAASSSTTCAGTSPNGAQLTYDYQGQLASWQNAPTSPSATAGFLYDGAGERVAQQVTQGGTTTTTVYVANIEEVATSGSSTTTTTYYYASGKRIAVGVNGSISYLVGDALGSATVALSPSGGVTATILYAPYGAARYSVGAMPGSYGFTGQRADAATGLDYYGARYYDPVAGQFTSADTELQGGGMDIQGLSRYAYVEGNPVARTDPSGHRMYLGDGTPCDIRGCDRGGNDMNSGECWGSGCGPGCGGYSSCYRPPYSPPRHRTTSPPRPHRVASRPAPPLPRPATHDPIKDIPTILITWMPNFGVHCCTTTIPDLGSWPEGFTHDPSGQIKQVNSDRGGSGSEGGGGSEIGIDLPDGTHIDIPNDYIPGPSRRGRGIVFRPPGETGNNGAIRVEPPGADPRYPNGYVRIYNEHGQPVDLNGKPKSQAETHFPL